MLYKKIKGIYQWLEVRKLDYLLVVLLVVMVMGWIQASPTFMDPDSFYHVKLTQMMGDGLVLDEFPWLQGTDLEHYFTDHHWLYHLILLPFILLWPAFIGAKAVTVIFSALLFLYLYWWMKRNQAKWPWLFIFVLLGIFPFMFRINLVKIPAIGILALLVCLDLAIHYRYKWLFL
ncbi:MAG: hypothetical protein NUV82_01290, partial [Candidatus Komeilibacteria bacterium]|nr:hypothetical protein [Candidatus Komeilibacteria bacterium]